jgi:hypothetical protein
MRGPHRVRVYSPYDCARRSLIPGTLVPSGWRVVYAAAYVPVALTFAVHSFNRRGL